jgi:1-deoxy-D-xylulose-5-phosphate reductoisomerase
MSGQQRLAILGSTGSIGKSSLEVARHHPERLRVHVLAAFGSDLELLAEQVAEFSPLLVAVRDRQAAEELRGSIDERVELVGGRKGLLAAATHPEVDRVVAAVVGAAGLPAVYAALSAGKDVALANKESLVVAGALLKRVAAESGAEILPVDSEHAALHQALRCGDQREVRRLVLTASGGPFLNRPEESWSDIRPEEAVRHPNWEMGAKISVDSSTLMNKGLELIEAHHLFDLPGERIDVVVHPQSVVHSMVEYRDGSWIAQLAANDMVVPIQYALAFPERWENSFERLEPRDLGTLDFQPVPERLTRAVDLARQALESGGSAPAVLNAANEEAVRAFLAGKVRFPRILDLVEEVLGAHEVQSIDSLEAARHWTDWGRSRAAVALES